MAGKIPLYKIFTDREDNRAVNKVLQRGMDWAIGPEIAEFEKKLASYIGTKYCIAFNSGTSAGHAALLAININSGEVIVPSFTFISTANWPLMVNAKPKFVDIEEENFGLNPERVKSEITKNTKAIIPIHYGGLPCKIIEINRIARNKKIPLIEDCAEAFGTKIKGVSVGTFGQMSIFSFAPNKILTTGEGGAICTDSRKIFEKLQLIRSHGRLINENYFKTSQLPNYISIGYNWRMSSMTAALGLSQFDKLDRIIQLRRRHARFYVSKLKKINEIKLPDEPKDHLHVYQLFTIQLKNNLIRHKLQKFLASKGIMTKVFFEPIHLSKFYKKSGFGKKSLSNTEKISRTVLSLPIFPGLKSEEITHICDSIKEFFQN
jgi:perosamine synthetase|tara:strand:+ start:661 stop:1788 length:1128 start_codon:yes stop_codon:yes gene_type:complete